MQRLSCPRCHAAVQVPAGQPPTCRSCGYGGYGNQQTPERPAAMHAPTANPSQHAFAPSGPSSGQQTAGFGVPTGHVPMQVHAHHYYPPARPPVSEGRAIAALLVNILVWPGVGTLIGGRIGSGIAQTLLWGLGWILLIVLVGLLLLPAIWIWGLVSGIQIMNDAKAAQYAYGPPGPWADDPAWPR